MTITISLPPETEKKLLDAAAKSGVGPAAYAGKLIENGLNGGTFDQILAPVRKRFEDSGLTDDELTSLFEEARDEAWQQRQSTKGK
jgi:hypothetical protein